MFIFNARGECFAPFCEWLTFILRKSTSKVRDPTFALTRWTQRFVYLKALRHMQAETGAKNSSYWNLDRYTWKHFVICRQRECDPNCNFTNCNSRSIFFIKIHKKRNWAFSKPEQFHALSHTWAKNPFNFNTAGSSNSFFKKAFWWTNEESHRKSYFWKRPIESSNW